MTKKQRALYDYYLYAWKKGPKTELYDVYGKYSKRKQEALNYCKGLRYRLNVG